MALYIPYLSQRESIYSDNLHGDTADRRPDGNVQSPNKTGGDR